MHYVHMCICTCSHGCGLFCLAETRRDKIRETKNYNESRLVNTGDPTGSHHRSKHLYLKKYINTINVLAQFNQK